MSPLISIALYYPNPNPNPLFLKCFQQLLELNYPKKRIILIIYSYPYQEDIIQNMNINDYFFVFHQPLATPPHKISQEIIKLNFKFNSDYCLLITGNVFIQDLNILYSLSHFNRNIIGSSLAIDHIPLVLEDNRPLPSTPKYISVDANHIKNCVLFEKDSFSEIDNLINNKTTTQTFWKTLRKYGYLTNDNSDTKSNQRK